MGISTKPFQTHLSEDILKLAYSNFEEDAQRRQQVIAIIRQWMAQQPHLRHIHLDDYSIISFARGCKYSTEKIKTKLDLLLTLRTALPEFFSGWDPMRPEIQAALSCGSFLPLPDFDQLGRKVIIMRTGCYDPYRHKAEDIEKANFMISDIMVRDCEQMFVTGMVIIYDLDGYTLNHFTQRSLALTKKHFYYIQNASPLSPKCINFIHIGPVFHKLNSIMMPLINDKIKQRLKFHGSDMQSLYQEIDRKILPKDYGGDGNSLAELTDYWKKKVEMEREYLLESEKNLRVDESRRLGKAKTAQEMFGIEGSFRKLNVD